MPENLTTVVGFDFGSHWIGVAVGQTLTRQATPLTTLNANDWESIKRLLDEWLGNTRYLDVIHVGHAKVAQLC